LGYFRIEGGSTNKLPLMIEKKLNLQDEGIAVDMHQFDTGSFFNIISCR
jgi:hypothetical protein